MKKGKKTGHQGRVKIKKITEDSITMKDEKNIIRMLQSGDFDLSHEALELLMQQEHISDRMLEAILGLENEKFIQGEFLERFEFFSASQIQIIEQFIHQHINDRDYLFASCLIDCANFNNMLSINDICVEFVEKRRYDCVVIAALDYIFEHMNFHDIARVVRLFNRVLNNKSYYQNCQTIASFHLFRLTHHSKYYDFLKSLVLEGGKINYMALKNCLQKRCYNHKQYFAYHDDLILIITEREKNNC